MYLAAILDKLAEIDQRIEGLAADTQAGPASVETDIVELREPAGVEAAPGNELTFAVRGIHDSFPGASHLRAAGYDLMTEIPRDEKSLTAIPGIGKATAKAILEALGG